MKTQIFALLTFTFISTGGAIAQEEVEKTPMKVEVKEKDGELELKITTEENGHPVEMVYTGEEAKKKLEEIKAESGDEGKQVEVVLTEENGVKKLKVITKENGEETVEVFEGEAAEAKLKELEEGEKKDKKASDFKLKKENKVLEKSAN